ncbi:MAG: Maf family protein [Clostridia bacterium]|nr:Maf family protein [Clostridia bacterium]
MELKETTVILASGSPRRIDMLRADGIEPVIVKPDCAEDIHMALHPRQEVMALALRKNLRALDMLRERGTLPLEGVILSADTMVVLNGRAMGKPRDEADAVRILNELNGRWHTVCSGACISRLSDGRRIVFWQGTDVQFRTYTREDIEAYVATGEPMDKAGAYAIQGGFAPYVRQTWGPLDNVIGFPYEEIKNILKQW